jgi:hypothetical protein
MAALRSPQSSRTAVSIGLEMEPAPGLAWIDFDCTILTDNGFGNRKW